MHLTGVMRQQRIFRLILHKLVVCSVDVVSDNAVKDTLSKCSGADANEENFKIHVFILLLKKDIIIYHLVLFNYCTKNTR